jgi:hypothetical protein
MKYQVEVGEKWQDRDRRRFQSGILRTFEVTRVTDILVECRNLATGKITGFNRNRFGGNAMNDNFVLLSAAEGGKQ